MLKGDPPMNPPREVQRLSKEQLHAAIQKESKRFEEHYSWIEKHMPASFFEEVDQESILLIVYALMGFNLNDYFSHIHLKNMAFTLSLDSPDTDLKVLRHYRSYGIKNYRSFVSNEPPPFPGLKAPLRIARILFSDFVEKTAEDLYPGKRARDRRAGQSAQPKGHGNGRAQTHRLLKPPLFKSDDQRTANHGPRYVLPRQIAG